MPSSMAKRRFPGRRDLIVDGYEYRKLSFVKKGYAVRYKLLRNGKRQILNVVLPGDIVGIPASFLDRAAYSVTAITDVTMNVVRTRCLCAALLSQAPIRAGFELDRHSGSDEYAEHIIDVGRRTPVERLSHFLLELHARLQAVGLAGKAGFALPFSQEVMADVLGMSLPHLNRMMQRLRSEKLIAGNERQIEFLEPGAMQTLAQYQPQELASIPLPKSA